MPKFVNPEGEFEDVPEDPKDALPWREALHQLLAPYQPARSQADADTWYTTPDIISQLEQHFGVPGSDPMYQSSRPFEGAEVVQELEAMGYRAVNISGMGLHWLLARKGGIRD